MAETRADWTRVRLERLSSTHVGRRSGDATEVPFQVTLPRVGLQTAYPLSPEREDHDEVWCRPDAMTVEEVRAALRVLDAEAIDTLARAEALRRFAWKKFPAESFEFPEVPA